jgi:hypothetical protein
MSMNIAAAPAFASFLALFGFAAHADTLVQNRDEPGRNPYEVEAAISASCNFNGCSATFPVTPAGQRVVVEYVSCAIVSPSGTSPMAVTLGWTGGALHAFVPAVFQANSSSVSGYTVSAPMVFYLPAGVTPIIQVVFNGNAGAAPGDCLLSGYRVALP